MDNKTIKLNKKGLLARDYVIILIIFSVVVGVGGLMVQDMASVDNGYNVANMPDSNFDSSYNRLSEVSGNMSIGANSTRTGFGSLSGGAGDTFFSSTSIVFDLVFGSFSMVSSVFSSFASSFGIPPQIANIVFVGLLTIITVLITFIIISSLTKSKV